MAVGAPHSAPHNLHLTPNRTSDGRLVRCRLLRRRLLNLLTALSLLLCVAVVALWVRNWNTTGPAGESAAWAAALDVKRLFQNRSS